MFKARVVHISYRVLFEGQVERVVLPGVMGEFEVADLHAPIVALLAHGQILIRTAPKQHADEQTHIPVDQGLVRFDGKELYAIVE